MGNVCFVILHYRDFDATEKCVQSILRMERQDEIRIVIVDNDIREPEERRKRLRDRFAGLKNVTVLPIRENGGFSYANNQGYRRAKELWNARHIIVLNNDIEFLQTDFIEKLYKAGREHPCHILAPDIIRQSTGEHQNPMDVRLRTDREAAATVRLNRIGLRFYPLLYPLLHRLFDRMEKNRLRQQEQNREFYSSVRDNIVPFGACLIFLPEFVQAEDAAFEPETPFFYEEYLLTLRCGNKGYRIVYDPALKVLHEGAAATKKNFGSEKKRLEFVMRRTMEACEIYREQLKKAETPSCRVPETEKKMP